MISIFLYIFTWADIGPEQLEQWSLPGKKETLFRIINDNPFAGTAYADNSDMAAFFLNVLGKKFNMVNTGIPQELTSLVTGFFQEDTGLVVDYKKTRIYLHGVEKLTANVKNSLEYYYNVFHNRKPQASTVKPNALPSAPPRQRDVLDTDPEIRQVQITSLKEEAEKLAAQAKNGAEQGTINDALQDFIHTLDQLTPGQDLPEIDDFKALINSLTPQGDQATSSPKPLAKQTPIAKPKAQPTPPQKNEKIRAEEAQDLKNKFLELKNWGLGYGDLDVTSKNIIDDHFTDYTKRVNDRLSKPGLAFPRSFDLEAKIKEILLASSQKYRDEQEKIKKQKEQQEKAVQEQKERKKTQIIQNIKNMFDDLQRQYPDRQDFIKKVLEIFNGSMYSSSNKNAQDLIAVWSGKQISNYIDEKYLNQGTIDTLKNQLQNILSKNYFIKGTQIIFVSGNEPKKIELTNLTPLKVYSEGNGSYVNFDAESQNQFYQNTMSLKEEFTKILPDNLKPVLSQYITSNIKKNHETKEKNEKGHVIKEGGITWSATPKELATPLDL